MSLLSKKKTQKLFLEGNKRIYIDQNVPKGLKALGEQFHPAFKSVPCIPQWN